MNEAAETALKANSDCKHCQCNLAKTRHTHKLRSEREEEQEKSSRQTVNIGHGKFAKPAPVQGNAGNGTGNGTGNVSSSAAVPLDQQWDAVDMRYEECKAGREEAGREGRGRQAEREAGRGRRDRQKSQAKQEMEAVQQRL